MASFTKHDFLNEMQSSKYIKTFQNIPGLLDSVGDLLNEYSNKGFPICIGVAENFDLKYEDGNVICRLEQDGAKVKVAGKLNGTSVKIDKKKYFIEIRRKYQLMLGRSHINDSSDVKTLMKILEKFIISNEDYKPKNK